MGSQFPCYKNSQRAHISCRNHNKEIPGTFHYLHEGERGLIREGGPGKGMEAFGSSLSGGAEPLFTIPNTSQSLAAMMAQMREGKGGQK